MVKKETKVEKDVVKLEKHVAKLEGAIKPMAQFSKVLVLAEHRGVKVLDMGLRLDQLRPLVECAKEIQEKEKE